VSFAVWAPNAKAVRVVGDWNSWDGRVHPMRSLGSSGVWEIFLPGVAAGAHYKYELVTSDGRLILKTDPMAFALEPPPDTASVVVDDPAHEWGDDAWMQARALPTCFAARWRCTRSTWVRGATPTVTVGPASPDVPGAGRAAPCLCGRLGFHPRRDDAGGRAPFQRLVGVPGVGVLRADVPLRLPGRLPRPGGRPAPSAGSA
jgi:hypothetical protein